MENKPKRRIQLNRETLRNLSAEALADVHGGNMTPTTGWWCPSTYQSMGGPHACNSSKSVSYCQMQCC